MNAGGRHSFLDLDLRWVWNDARGYHFTHGLRIDELGKEFDEVIQDFPLPVPRFPLIWDSVCFAGISLRCFGAVSMFSVTAIILSLKLK